MSYILHNSVFSQEFADSSAETILASSISNQTLDSLLVIVPTGRRLRLLSRMIIRTMYNLHGKPIEKLPVSTLEQFVQECAGKILGEKIPRLVSPAYRLALMEEAAELAELKFFRGKSNSLSPSALERLANVIWGLKEDGITPENIKADIEKAVLDNDETVDFARLGDIYALYVSYEKILGEKLADYERLLQLTNRELQNSLEKERSSGEKSPLFSQIFGEKTTLILDGFSEFKQPELEFLGLLRTAPLNIQIMLDFSDANGPLFANLTATLEHLRTAGFTAVSLDNAENYPDYRCEKHTPLVSYLRRWLFNTEKEIRHDGLNDIVKIFGFQSRLEEVRGIAKLVKYLALEEKIPPSEICIVMRHPELYTGLFREIFALYDIPANITDRYPVEKSPVAIAVFAVLDMLIGGFERAGVHRALQSPHLKFNRLENGSEIPLDAANLYDVAMRLRISGGARTGGAKSWLTKMDKRLEYLRKRRNLLENAKFSDKDEMMEVVKELEKTTIARQDFAALLEILPTLDEKMTPHEFAELVKAQILKKLKVRESIEEFAGSFSIFNRTSNPDEKRSKSSSRLSEEAEKDARSFSVFVNLLDEAAFVMNTLHPNRKRSAEDFVERLRTATRAEKYQVREKLGYGVTITSIEQIRTIPFRVTILCGAVDGEFPVAYNPETFLGKEIPESEERFLKRERLQFYQALTNNPDAFDSGTKRIFLTYPLFEGDTDRVRSPFVDALLKITSLEQSGCVFNIPQIRNQLAIEPNANSRLAEIPWIDAVASDEELLRECGNALISGDEKSLEILRAEFFNSNILEYLEKFLQKKAKFCELGDSSRVRIGDDDENSLALVAGTDKAFSITALEEYSACPYQYFAKRALKLDVQQEFDDALSPMERGSFLHSIMEQFYREIQKEQLADGTIFVLSQKNPALPPLAGVKLQPEFQEIYLEKLKKIADEAIERISYDHAFFDLEREELLGSKNRRGKLELWLSEELKRIANGWEFAPALFEFSFGGQSSKAEKSPIPPVELAGNLRLRGKIDRLEILRHEDGSVEILIGDYKSGSIDNISGNSDIKSGKSLQMPLYISAIQKILAEEYGIEATAAGGAYYSFSPKAKVTADETKIESVKFVLLEKDSGIVAQNNSLSRSSSQVLKSPDTAESMVEKSIGIASKFVEEIAHGNFDIKPRNTTTTCEYCNFKTVCRISEVEAK